MITFDHVSARRAPFALTNVTLAWGAGVHAIVGVPADGGPLLLDLLAGAERARSGRITVLGAAPGEVVVRKQVARVAMDPALPDGLRVDETLAVAAGIRGEPARAASERLAVLGVEALAQRRVRSLSRAEARAVALVEGLTSTRVRVLLVDEPLLAIDPRAAGRVATALREKALGGSVVVVTASSIADANALGSVHVMLRAGALLSETSSLENLAGFAPHGARLVAVLKDVADARKLVVALGRISAFEGIESDGPVVRLRGGDVVTLARATAHATHDANVDLCELRLEAPELDALRAGAAGVHAATYDAAYSQTRATLTSRPAEAAAHAKGTP